MQHSLAQGSLFKNIAVFSIPYFASYFLQALYGMADLFVVGQSCGAETITAVAVGSQAMHFLTVMVVGVSMGVTVMTGRATGANLHKVLPRIVGNAATLFCALSVLLTAACLFFCEGIVQILQTPTEAVLETKTYLQICFAGIPFIAAYNLIAAVLRGMGDSKHPMYFVATACILNVALDFLLVCGLHLGAKGAALATVISQASSVFIALLSLKKFRLGIRIQSRDFTPNRTLFKGILGVGLPVAIQDGFIQTSFLFITVIANTRGIEIAAAVGIVEKILSFLFLVPSSMLSTVAAICAQCFGANDADRARRTLWLGAGISAGFGLLFSVLFQFLSKAAVGIFTGDSAVVEFGAEYLQTYVLDCFFAGIHFCFSGYFCARGLSILSFAHNFLSIVLFRVPGTWLASEFFPDTLSPMGFAAPAGSLFSVLFCIAVYGIFLRNHASKA